jgi:hypothetical protein
MERGKIRENEENINAYCKNNIYTWNFTIYYITWKENEVRYLIEEECRWI